MNFLTLAQRLRQEANISGSGPATVIGQTGISKNLVDWIRAAWLEIQESRDNWNFLWREFSFQTIDGTRDYDPENDLGLADFSRWDTDKNRTSKRIGSFRIYLTSSGPTAEGPLRYIEYREWRDDYRTGMAGVDNNTPARCTVLPNKSLRLDPAPNDVFTVSGDYYARPVELTANSDTPAIASEYHMAIVYKALGYYAAFHEVSALFNSAATNYDLIMRPLLRKELPQIGIAGPLA